MESVLGVFWGWSWWWSHSQGQVGAESSRVPLCCDVMTGRHCIVTWWKWEPVLLSIVLFLVCVELQNFNYFFCFFFSPYHSDIPLLKEAWGLLCLSGFLHFGFLPPLLSLPLGQKHSVQSSPSSQAVPWIPPRRDALSWRSKGCCQVASWMHQWSWCSTGFPIPSASGAQGTEWIWALLSSSPARCLTAGSEELLFSRAFLLLTPACCSLSAFLALCCPESRG